MLIRASLLFSPFLLLPQFAAAQALSGSSAPTATADPSHAAHHLPEEYIWAAGEVTVHRPDRSKFSWARTDLRVEPRFFRTSFDIASTPEAATLYVGGPREAHVYLNGRLLGDFSTNPAAPINFRVFHADAASALRPGRNVLAIEAIRGRGVVSGAGPIETQWLAYGEVLAAKIVTAGFGTELPALVISNKAWRSSNNRAPNWQEPDFDDHSWSGVESLGPVDDNIDLRQWSADAGMYGWPGYSGMASWLRTYDQGAVAVSHVFAGTGRFTNPGALAPQAAAGEVRQPDRKSEPFSVSLPQPAPTDAEAPSLLLDFGREIAGRVLVESACDCVATLSVAYGESEIEAMATGLTPGQRGGNYLGTNLLEVPANGIARGPKSAFRYVRVTFLRGAPSIALRSIRAEGIQYPVKQAGSFESSDPLLDRIWQTGAYTAHLCMQDGIWDAPKRDRGRWVGDLDVEGRVISTAFGDSFLTEDTLRRLARSTPPSQYVNGIPGYSALWVTSLANLYDHTGDLEFLNSQHDALLRILARMDQDLDPEGVVGTSTKGWGFVDWAPNLYGQTPEARIGTNLHYLRAYEAAPALLRAVGDNASADRYQAQLERARSAARQAFLSGGTIGQTWQLNALAVLTSIAADGNNAIWSGVLSHVKQDSPADQVISPYFGSYLLDAMAAAGHPQEGLKWIRQYWGGMLAEGATSFWESYDLRWPKTDAHLSLQADGTTGYFVSLAHGWSGGPTAWLTENVLGLTPAMPGYKRVSIRPNLLDLSWARGSVPTPFGEVRISIDSKKGIDLDLPEGIAGATLHPPVSGGTHVLVNGRPRPLTSAGDLILDGAGHFAIELRSSRPR